MSSSKLPPSTLKGVKDAVRNASYGDLPNGRRSAFCSGIDTFSSCVGRDPSELDANITALRAIERFAKPQINDVTKAGYATALSRVLAALEYVGVSVDRRRDMPLSPEWAAHLDRLEERDRMDSRKFAGAPLAASRRPRSPKRLSTGTSSTCGSSRSSTTTKNGGTAPAVCGTRLSPPRGPATRRLKTSSRIV
jgi:hypothetical protein